ncbi:hypothetical protein O0L34_g13408 [Tuta absoluta]|nr:hypothetical protein O0L34_g13408 [Tuta absoluta]
MGEPLPQVKIPCTTLNNGLLMPMLGYGTWLGLNDQLEFNYADVPKLPEVLSYAIDVGYRHIDTAHLYRVEPEIGQVIAEKICQGVVKREDLFVTTKVWQHHHRPEDVLKACCASLKRLGLQYLDQLLMHWPMAISEDGCDEKIDYVTTWQGFEQVYEQGLAKSIGVSNFNVQQLERLLKCCRITPATNQVEINLNLGQKSLVDYCQAAGIVVVAYSPFGTMVPSRNLPNSPEPKMDNKDLRQIASSHCKTVTQIALRYLFERGIVSIPKTLTKKRVVENASIFDFELAKCEFDLLASFDNGFRTVNPTFWQNYEHYPFEKMPDAVKMEIPKALLKWKNGANNDID